MAFKKLFVLAIAISSVSVFCHPLPAAEKTGDDITEAESIAPPLRRGASYGHSSQNDGTVLADP